MSDNNTEVVVKQNMNTSFTPAGGLIPQNFEQLYRLSNIMSQSGMMPKGLTTVPAVFVAVQMGLELGLSPMQAVQNIAVINGRPSIWGDAALALVRCSRHWIEEDFDESFEGEYPKDSFKAICTVKRNGDKKITSREFSIGDAKLAGLWNKEGPWRTYPKRMLQMRARTWALRDKFTDTLKGMRTAEEVIDLSEIDTNSYSVSVPRNNEFDEKPFNDLIADDLESKLPADINKEMFSRFIAECATKSNFTIDQCKIEASQDFDIFLDQFRKWEKQQNKKKEVKEQSKAEQPKLSELQLKVKDAPVELVLQACKNLKFPFEQAITDGNFSGLKDAECEKLIQEAGNILDRDAIKEAA